MLEELRKEIRNLNDILDLIEMRVDMLGKKYKAYQKDMEFYQETINKLEEVTYLYRRELDKFNLLNK